LPALVTRADIRGDLHLHSDWIDGTAPIAAMAKAVQAQGYEYIALTDHSRRAAMAHDLDPARFTRQSREIDRVNAQLQGLAILKGIELDILKHGSLDLPDAALAKLDIVVAAIHSYFDLPREAQTERMIRATQNSYVSIIAHPTGRLLDEREAYQIDMDRVIVAARDLGCHLEFNAQPERLDLNDTLVHAAKQAGVKLAIPTDAHSVDASAWIRFGVDQAGRG
jgi:DNA polymerase (family X)